MKPSDLRKRASSAPFRAFRKRRVRELVAAGMSPDRARMFAFQETRARARVSFSYPINEVLEANLEMIQKPGQTEPVFCLVYPPKA